MSKNIFLFTFCLYLCGCVQYQKKPDVDFSMSVKQSEYTVSLNLFKNEGVLKNPVKIRADDSDKARSIAKTMQETHYFKNINLEFEDFLKKDNYVIDCSYETEVTNIFGIQTDSRDAIFSLLLPLPIFRKTTMHWEIVDKNGNHKSYSASVSHKRWLFFPTLPFALIQRLLPNWDDENDDKVLIQELIKHLDLDKETQPLP